nr:hypothetical protein [Tanacetum cinerariifolium]
NADGFDSDPGNDDEINYRRRRLTELIREIECVINDSGQWKYSFYTGQQFTTPREAKNIVYLHSIERRRNLKLYKNDNVKIRARCDGKVPVFIMSQAVGLDSNNGIYLLAYALVEAESKSSWCWFLWCLGDDIDLHPNSNLTFISDRQMGIVPSIKPMYSSAEHRYCLRYIHENMKQGWCGQAYKDLLWRVASATNVKDFEKCRAKSNLLLNNICKVFNGKIVGCSFVDVETMTCSCRQWELTRIPCKDVIAGCWNMARVDYMEGNILSQGRPRKKRKRSKHKDEPFVKDGKVSTQEPIMADVSTQKPIVAESSEDACTNDDDDEDFLVDEENEIVEHDNERTWMSSMRMVSTVTLSTNPNTTVKIAVERNTDPSLPITVFQRIYVCLGALKLGFRASKKDLLGLDGAFMKGTFLGQALAAVGLRFKQWNLSIDLCGIVPSIKPVYSSTEHRYCLRYIHENIKQGWCGQAYKDLLWRAASATNVKDFKKRRAKSDLLLNNICEGLLVSVLLQVVRIWLWLTIWRETYSHKVQPICETKYWEKSTCPTTLLLPKHHVQVGRPRKKRKRSKHKDEPFVKDGKLSRKERTITC